LNFTVSAMGDSYNDISMLQTAQHALLFRPPETILTEYPQFKVAYDYAAVRRELGNFLG
jgi:phosphoserine / homoserine phosphotransferase